MKRIVDIIIDRDIFPKKKVNDNGDEVDSSVESTPEKYMLRRNPLEDEDCLDLPKELCDTPDAKGPPASPVPVRRLKRMDKVVLTPEISTSLKSVD